MHCPPLWSGGLQAGGPGRAEELDANFSALKKQFEIRARQDLTPAQLTMLGLETTARAWSLAAVSLTEDPEAREQWRSRAESVSLSDRPPSGLREEPGDRPDGALRRAAPEERHSAALELYYQAFRETVLYLVTANRQRQLALEAKLIHRQTRDKLARLTARPQRELEKRVVLSGALVSLATVAVRSLGGNLMNPQMEVIVKGLADQAEAIGRRSDLHYRAKLQLLYIGNLRRLTALIFLLGRQAGPPLSRELALMHGNLNHYGPRRNLPGAQSLIWTAQAQAAIPLAYWLSRQRPASPPAL